MGSNRLIIDADILVKQNPIRGGMEYDCIMKYINSFSNKPLVFLAFSFKDIEFAEELERILQKSSIRTWMATREIKPGDDWQLKVKENLQVCDYFLALVSKSSNESYWTQWEFQMAIQNEKSFNKPQVIPILIENVIIPNYLNNRQYVDFRPYSKNNAEKVIKIFDETKYNFFEGLDE